MSIYMVVMGILGLPLAFAFSVYLFYISRNDRDYTDRYVFPAFLTFCVFSLCLLSGFILPILLIVGAILVPVVLTAKAIAKVNWKEWTK